MRTTEIPSILVPTQTAQALPVPPWRQVHAYYDEASINWMEPPAERFRIEPLLFHSGWYEPMFAFQSDSLIITRTPRW
ncbi:hypothetical protein AVEN_115308-1 [Araneus ventricosus]|uniref:Uncharacterized protein n=1 Tax=Araneus ventricosus TaxID=182803 RepID=A0A4Y1ZZ85_ARAVE|nr:hypothetical protein AVEN_115308-1 [Araneus ventricosus]